MQNSRSSHRSSGPQGGHSFRSEGRRVRRLTVYFAGREKCAAWIREKWLRRALFSLLRRGWTVGCSVSYELTNESLDECPGKDCNCAEDSRRESWGLGAAPITPIDNRWQNPYSRVYVERRLMPNVTVWPPKYRLNNGSKLATENYDIYVR
jgi:hypothetical protein